MNKITDKNSYLDSINNRNLKIYLMGELIKEPLDHPIIRPSIEAMAETYELAVREPELASATSPYTGCLLYTSPSPRDATLSRMPSSA